jgi:hypothetical protein
MNEKSSRPPPRKAAAKTAAKKGAPEKAAPAKQPPKASTSVPADLESRVRIVAYLRAERRGFAPGYEIEDWLAAEAEVSARQQAEPAAQPRKSAARKPRVGGTGTG